MVTLLRVVGGLNLMGGVLGAVIYWDAASNPWAIASTIGILVGGFVSFLVFTALAEILESCQETTTGIALLRKRQNQLEQAVESAASE